MTDRPKLGKINPLLSGNRFGGPQGGSFDVPVVSFDRYQATLVRAAKFRAYALTGAFATVLVMACFIASALQNRRLAAEAEAARRLPCQGLALGLQAADNPITRVQSDRELMLATGPLSLAIHPVLSTCIEPGRADAFAQQLAEARSVAAAVDVIRVVRESLEK